jgi:glycosyltransferase involved in cell wall biosynthesis
MPRVSIILPTYNGERYLRESMESCLDQTFRDLEVIAVDDCSTDGTSDILSSYSGDSRVRIIRHDQNRRLPGALNTGFAQASGELLTWTSDDNRFTPDAIAVMAEFLDQEKTVGFVYSDYWIVDDVGKVQRRQSAGPPEHLREGSSIACFLYRREVYETVGEYDPKLFRIEDYDYWLRVARRFEMAWLPEPLYYYRRHGASLTGTDDWRNRIGMLDRLQTEHFGPDPARLSRIASKYLIAVAFERHAEGQRKEVVEFCLRALRHDPGLLRNRGVRSILFQAITGVRLDGRRRSGS